MNCQSCGEDLGLDPELAVEDDELDKVVSVTRDGDGAAISQTDYYCNIQCATTGETVNPQHLLEAAADVFQETTLGGMGLYGRAGYHTLFAWNGNLDPAFDTAVHMALDDVLEELWVDADVVEEEFGEVTPERYAQVARREASNRVGLFNDSYTAELFEDKLAEYLESLSQHPEETGGDE